MYTCIVHQYRTNEQTTYSYVYHEAFKPSSRTWPWCSSNQYSMYWLRHMPVHWTRPVHSSFRRSRNRSRLRRDPSPPRLVGGPLEAPCRRPVFTRFGFTAVRKVRRFWAVYQRQFGGRLRKMGKEQRRAKCMDRSVRNYGILQHAA